MKSASNGLDEKTTYSRKLDDSGNALEEIEDKHAYHHMDAERYIISWLHRGSDKWEWKPNPRAATEYSKAPPGVFDTGGDRRERW